MPSDLAPLSRLLDVPADQSVACKVCGGPAPAFGRVSFEQSCVGPRAPQPDDVPIQYQRCANCGLLFTSAFDAWTAEEFQAQIYNDDYVKFDPDYVVERPANFAATLGKIFEGAKAEIRLLDYGGGNGKMAEGLRAQGFACETYDPFSATHRSRPAGRFNLITCIETVEHLPRPLETLADLASFAADQALVLFTTVLQPADILEQKLGWWYVGPRNGHITFFTPRSLALMWAKVGFACASLNAGAHLALRNPPPFAHDMLKRAHLNRA